MEQLKMTPCKICNSLFTVVKKSKAKYCSDECRKKSITGRPKKNNKKNNIDNLLPTIKMHLNRDEVSILLGVLKSCGHNDELKIIGSTKFDIGILYMKIYNYWCMEIEDILFKTEKSS